MLMTQRADDAVTARAFLDAAARGDVDGVDAWLASDPCGDVNVVRGEGWTALHYAASHGHVHVVQRLVVQRGVDLNATTVTGTSALAMALKRQNNTLTKLLLTHGASRYTISDALLAAALASPWMWADVKRMLSPTWSVRWSPALHVHFPTDQREKCRLVVFANTLALRRQRRTGRAARHCIEHRHGSSTDSALVDEWYRRSVGIGIDAVYELQERLWRLLRWLRGNTEDAHSSERTLAALGSRSGAPATACEWIYLPTPVLHLVLEFAMFLW